MRVVAAAGSGGAAAGAGSSSGCALASSAVRVEGGDGRGETGILGENADRGPGLEEGA